MQKAVQNNGTSKNRTPRQARWLAKQLLFCLSKTTSLRSVFRNLIILVMCVVFVFATGKAKIGIFAQDTETATVNKYSKVLDGGDLENDCSGDGLISRVQNLNETNLNKMVRKYHENINCMFNKRIEKLVWKLLDMTSEGRKIEGSALTELISPPGFGVDPQTKKPTAFREPCKDVNLSTYCLAQDTVKEYFEFKDALESAKKYQKDMAIEFFQAKAGTSVSNAPNTITDATVDFTSGIKALQKSGEYINQIDLEADIARQALDQTLAAYNELQMALPMHRKYREVITALEKFRDGIAKVRDQIELYPSTFKDVTTSACT